MLNTYIVNPRNLRNASKATVISSNDVGIKPVVVEANLFKMESEIWKDVIGYEGHYQVSNLGQVRSMDRHLNYRYGLRLKKGGILNQYPNHKGYHRVSLIKNNKVFNASVHRLVAQQFIDNSFNKSYVNHKDGIKSNNHVENIEWVTATENMIHSELIGLHNGRRKINI